MNFSYYYIEEPKKVLIGCRHFNLRSGRDLTSIVHEIPEPSLFNMDSLATSVAFRTTCAIRRLRVKNHGNA